VGSWGSHNREQGWLLVWSRDGRGVEQGWLLVWSRDDCWWGAGMALGAEQGWLLVRSRDGCGVE